MIDRERTCFSRRHLLAGSSAALASGIVGLPYGPSLAKAPMLNTQAPSFYRFKLGDFEATVVSDGPLPIGPASRTFRGPSPEELSRLITDHFLPTDNRGARSECARGQHWRPAHSVRYRHVVGETAEHHHWPPA